MSQQIQQEGRLGACILFCFFQRYPGEQITKITTSTTDITAPGRPSYRLDIYHGAKQ
jgi:hypothetical protein